VTKDELQALLGDFAASASSANRTTEVGAAFMLQAARPGTGGILIRAQVERRRF
jgi:hypothetical protein